MLGSLDTSMRAIATRAVLGFIAVCAVGAGALSCGVFSDPGVIVFAVGSEGARDIAVVRPDGEGRQIVIQNESDDFAPVWSPDGKRIAFLSDRDGNVELYVSSADGSLPMRITNTLVAESQQTWSPDGGRIAYTSLDSNGDPRVFWVDLADLQPNRLLFGDNSETDPAWSPEGVWVAFAVLDDRGQPVGLILRNPDGVNRLQVTDSPDSSPAWSPDGSRLAFVSTRDGNEEIYMLKIGDDGPEGQAERLTDNPGRDFSPQWSPDGDSVAFLSDRNGNVDVFVVRKDGSDQKALTRNNVHETAISWGADGRLVFVSEPSGKPDLFLIQDGTQRQLTSDREPITFPDW